MFHHMILMCSDFTSGKRIAFHQVYSRIDDAINFKKDIQLIKKQFQTISFSFHHIETDEQSHDSIGEYDNYFTEVIFFDDKEKFICNLRDSIKITPEDIAKYIVIKGEFDKLQILKLVFFSYSEYAGKYEEPLFEECFETWPYGPVIPKLYYELEKYQYRKVKPADINVCRIQLELKLSRVRNRDEVINCIDKALSKYGDKKGGEMIDITHQKGSPWDIVKNNKGLGKEIPYEIIREFARQ